MDKKCSFVPKNVHLVLKKQKIVLFTLKMKFLPKNFNKMYKFWIKTVVLYPKMYIWFWKKQKICTFYSKNEVFAKNFTKMYEFWIKTSFVPKNVHLVLKNKKNCTFYTKNEVNAKQFHENVQILDKNCSFVPKNVHLVQKNQIIVLFTLKMKFLPRNSIKYTNFG